MPLNLLPTSPESNGFWGKLCCCVALAQPHSTLAIVSQELFGVNTLNHKCVCTWDNSPGLLQQKLERLLTRFNYTWQSHQPRLTSPPGTTWLSIQVLCKASFFRLVFKGFPSKRGIGSLFFFLSLKAFLSEFEYWEMSER